MPGGGVAPQQNKTKRELLWEQKMQEKANRMNPPLAGGNIIDNMKPPAPVGITPKRD